MMDPHFTALRVGHSVPDENFPVISNINYALIALNARLYEKCNMKLESNEESSRPVLCS